MEARVFVRQNGKTDAGDVSDPVPWWSFTKTALAIALLRLSDYGRVRLDEPVEGEPCTPVQLLRHEAGLPDDGSLPGYHADVEAGRSPWPTNDLLKAVEAERPRNMRGTTSTMAVQRAWRLP
jgi:CubicO group peptidase (beta-lactamase class C family)